MLPSVSDGCDGRRIDINRNEIVMYWAEAHIKITRMTLTIKLDRNWSSFQLANSTPPLSVDGSAIAPSARILDQLSLLVLYNATCKLLAVCKMTSKCLDSGCPFWVVFFLLMRKKGLLCSISPKCTLSQNGYGALLDSMSIERILFHCQYEAHRSLVCLVCFAFHTACKSLSLSRKVEFWPMHFHVHISHVCVCGLLLFLNTMMCIVKLPVPTRNSSLRLHIPQRH